MAGFRKRVGAEPDRSRETLDRAAATLRQLQRHGITAVPVADVLVMLGAGPEVPQAQELPRRHPRADPLTGCLPVSPGDQ